jgi:hypothetical protein
MVPVDQRPRPFDEWLALGLLFVVAALLLIRYHDDPFITWTALGSVWLAVAATIRRAAREQLIFLGFIMPLFVALIAAANHIVIRLTPRTMDWFFLRIDAGASTAIYHWTLAHALCSDALWVVYYSLAFFAAVVMSVTPWARRCLWSLSLTSFCAPFLYLVFPAAGPAHLGDRLAPRNCMPSMHLAWALVLAAYLPRRWRWAGALFALLTAAATLGTGEHYWIDLAAALAYAFAAVRVPLPAGLRSLRVSQKAGYPQGTPQTNS